MASTRRLPDRFPDGTKYVLESEGGMVRRYVEFPDGRKVMLASRKAAVCVCPDLQSVSIVPAVIETSVPRKRVMAKVAPRRTARALAHA
ncbi:MAG: hypothetical protein ACTHLO_11410 [Pseudolabrys sp.]